MTEPAESLLKEVAARPAITDEARRMLGQLADALKSRADLDSWAAVDLRVAFDPGTAIKPSAISTWLGRALDVLVFTPVASTWLGLMFATGAYSNTLNDPALTGQNFLQRWQAGFDNHIWGGLSFDRVTLITFILVAVVLTVALAHFVFRTRAEQGPKAMTYRLLSEALTAAERELAPVRLGAVGRVADEVGKVSAEVAATAAEIQKVGEAAALAQGEAAGTLDRVTTALTAVQAAATEVARAVMDMGDKLADATAATSSVADTEAEFGAKLLDATGKLDTTVDGLADRLTKAVAAGETQLTRTVTDSTEKVAAAMGDNTAKVGEALGGLTATATRNADTVDAAVESLGEVKAAALQVPAGLGALRTEVGTLHAEVGRLTNGIESLARTVAAMRPAAQPTYVPPRYDPPRYAPPRAAPPSSSGDRGSEKFDEAPDGRDKDSRGKDDRDKDSPGEDRPGEGGRGREDPGEGGRGEGGPSIIRKLLRRRR